MTQLAPTQGITTQGTPGGSAPAADALPFVYDYPNPRRRDHAIVLRTWTQSPFVTAIFALPPSGTNYDWPVPRGREHPLFLRGHVDKFKDFPPSPINYDFPNPYGRAYSSELRTFTIPLAINLLIPFKNYDFPNPLGRPFPISNRNWSQTPPTSIIPIPGSLLCAGIVVYWVVGGIPDLEDVVTGQPNVGPALTGIPNVEVCE